jgi:hypothetical protein
MARTPLALLCPLFYFYFVVTFLQSRKKLGFAANLIISMTISVAISLALLATAIDYSNSEQTRSTNRVGLSLPPAIEIGLAMLLLITWFYAQLIPWALIWFCSHVYRESNKVIVKPAERE